MTRYLDTLGVQLINADYRLEAERAPLGSRRSKRRSLPRAFALFGAALVVATPALAIISPWTPQLSRPGLDGPVQVDRSAPPAAVTSVLEILRREQTERDRQLAAPLIDTLASANLVDGVQADSVRAVAAGWVLVPVRTVLSRKGGSVYHDQLCLTDGSSTTCQADSDVPGNGVWLLAGNVLSGVVPDGVETVRFLPSDGHEPVRASVANNFYSLSFWPAQAPDRSKGIDHPRPPMNGTVQWLDHTGSVVGPSKLTLFG